MITEHDIQYVLSLGRLDPGTDIDYIIVLRNERLAPGTTPSVPSNPTTTEERRRKSVQQMMSLREEFWSLDDDSVRRRIEDIDTREFPDLALFCRALKSAVLRRGAFDRLKQHPYCFPMFLDLLKEIAIALPIKAARLREKLRVFAAAGAGYPDRRSPREFRRLARAIEREFPEISSACGGVTHDLVANPGFRDLASRIVTFIGGMTFGFTVWYVLHVLRVLS